METPIARNRRPPNRRHQVPANASTGRVAPRAVQVHVGSGSTGHRRTIAFRGRSLSIEDCIAADSTASLGSYGEAPPNRCARRWLIDGPSRRHEQRKSRRSPPTNRRTTPRTGLGTPTATGASRRPQAHRAEVRQRMPCLRYRAPKGHPGALVAFGKKRRMVPRMCSRAKYAAGHWWPDRHAAGPMGDALPVSEQERPRGDGEHARELPGLGELVPA